MHEQGNAVPLDFEGISNEAMLELAAETLTELGYRARNVAELVDAESPFEALREAHAFVRQVRECLLGSLLSDDELQDARLDAHHAEKRVSALLAGETDE